jgi:hypothetical protein
MTEPATSEATAPQNKGRTGGQRPERERGHRDHDGGPQHVRGRQPLRDRDADAPVGHDRREGDVQIGLVERGQEREFDNAGRARIMG